jgi:NAD+ synthase (glutamine-hydrolysing)
MVRELTGQETVPFGDGAIATRDTALASETCEELFTPAAPHIYLSLNGVEIFANGYAISKERMMNRIEREREERGMSMGCCHGACRSGSHHQLRKLQTRLDLLRSATQKAGGVYLYANLRGCDGGRL